MCSFCQEKFNVKYNKEVFNLSLKNHFDITTQQVKQGSAIPHLLINEICIVN